MIRQTVKKRNFGTIPVALLAVGFFSFFLFSGFWLLNTAPSYSSSELGIAAMSPLGEDYGLVVPASCPSDLHDDPTYGQACSACNATCGLCNAGTYQCGGVCSTGVPPCLVTGLTATCNAAGNQVTLNWNPADSATDYYVRLDYVPNNNVACTGGWLCSTPPDYASDFYPGTSISYPVTPGGASYSAWVHSHNAYNTQPPTTVSFACSDYRICPSSAILGGPSSTIQLNAYYSPSGTVNCAAPGGAIDVTNIVNWSSNAPGIATVDNGGSKGLVTRTGIGTADISVSAYSGANSPTAPVSVTCVPTINCSSPGPAATAANSCPSQTFNINDGCGGTIVCSGTRTCDFNWKEVSQ